MANYREVETILSWQSHCCLALFQRAVKSRISLSLTPPPYFHPLPRLHPFQTRPARATWPFNSQIAWGLRKLVWSVLQACCSQVPSRWPFSKYSFRLHPLILKCVQWDFWILNSPAKTHKSLKQYCCYGDGCD